MVKLPLKVTSSAWVIVKDLILASFKIILATTRRLTSALVASKVKAQAPVRSPKLMAVPPATGPVVVIVRSAAKVVWPTPVVPSEYKTQAAVPGRVDGPATAAKAEVKTKLVVAPVMLPLVAIVPLVAVIASAAAARVTLPFKVTLLVAVK